MTPADLPTLVAQIGRHVERIADADTRGAVTALAAVVSIMLSELRNARDWQTAADAADRLDAELSRLADETRDQRRDDADE